MKAVIPVAGAGTRLRPHTYTQPKPLIPVAGKPIIASIIDQLVDAGISEFIFIVGYLGDKIRDFVESRYSHLSTEFVYQDERLGLGHALWVARLAYEKCDDILIVLGDTIFDGDLNDILTSPNSCLGVKKVEDPREFGVVVMGEDGYIKQVIEKPRIPKSNLAIVGIYKITEVPKFISALHYVIEHNIEKPDDFVMKSVANKSSNKIYIIQNVDKKIPLETIAKNKDLRLDSLLEEMETIAASGTKLNLDYAIDEWLDEYDQEEILEYFKSCETSSLQIAQQELSENDYTWEQLKIMRIKFLSVVGN